MLSWGPLLVGSFAAGLASSCVGGPGVPGQRRPAAKLVMPGRSSDGSQSHATPDAPALVAADGGDTAEKHRQLAADTVSRSPASGPSTSRIRSAGRSVRYGKAGSLRPLAGVVCTVSSLPLLVLLSVIAVTSANLIATALCWVLAKAAAVPPRPRLVARFLMASCRRRCTTCWPGRMTVSSSLPSTPNPGSSASLISQTPLTPTEQITMPSVKTAIVRTFLILLS